MTTFLKSTHPAAVYDRAAGVLLGHAVGDALGVPYEFSSPPKDKAAMLGGGLGNYLPGEWSDDTQMSLAVVMAALNAPNHDLLSNLDEVATRFINWYTWGPPDIGNQTRAVLWQASNGLLGSPSRNCWSAAAKYATTHTSNAGNGALMRTESIALAYLHDRRRAAKCAADVAALTHSAQDVTDTCVLATETIRVAVLTGELDFFAGIDLLDEAHQSRWTDLIEQAMVADPGKYSPNGWTVSAFLAAVAAIASTPIPTGGWENEECLHLQNALHAAVRIGDDTDTVAAIAGAFLGAKWGASAVPWQWRRLVKGWAGAPSGTDRFTGEDLVAFATLLVDRRSLSDTSAWPLCETVGYGEPFTVAVPHPLDSGVLLGTSNCQAKADAVVSLCRMGTKEKCFDNVAKQDRVSMRLIDSDDPAANPNLGFVLRDAAQAVQGLRQEGKTVLLHCVAAQQRTPSAAIVYSRLLGQDSAAAQQSIADALHASIRGHGFVWDTAKTW